MSTDEVSYVKQDDATFCIEVDKFPVNLFSRCPIDGQKLFPDPIKSMVSILCYFTLVLNPA